MALGLGLGADGLAASCPAFRLETTDAGVYEVRYQDLAAAGLEGTLPGADLALLDRGRPTPLWLDDRDQDGRFGPGDRFEFVGERLAGEETWNHPAGDDHPYYLRCDSANALRIADLARPLADSSTAQATLMRRQHLERDRSLVRFAPATEAPDLWFWTKLSSLDAAPFEVPLDLAGMDAHAGAPLRVRLRLRGWSAPRTRVPGFADHRVEIALGKGVATVVEWNQEAGAQVVDLPPLATSDLRNPMTLSLHVPRRLELDTQRELPDVVLLDWIEVSYPHSGLVSGPLRLEASGTGAVALHAASGQLVAFTDGARLEVGSDKPFPVDRPAAPLVFDVVRLPDYRRPQRIELDVASDLHATSHRADYLIVTHPRFRRAIAPLAEYRRQTGLAVETVDVQDVYDEWSHGIADPHAIRDFVAYAWAHWTPPAPRFLLLVGDASWDPRNEPDAAGPAADAIYDPRHGTAFAAVESDPYPVAVGGKRRNLIPTWSYESLDGHAAGDNFFVDFDADVAPELAVGRLPVVEPAEVEAIVDKIVRYETAAPAGSWRSEVAFITSEDPGWQGWSDELASRATERGLTARRVYAPPVEAAENQSASTAMRADAAAVAALLADGSRIVHFIGHGGRFIWRTGPADWTRQRDLFNLDDIDRLPKSGRLPLVLSMTCYSAPFDHPTADSIGEKLLRVPERGAIAVFAASWRNTPQLGLSTLVLDNLYDGPTIGEAFQRAKRRSYNRDLVHQYNLLGDPALRLVGAEQVGRPATGDADAPLEVPAGAAAAGDSTP